MFGIVDRLYSLLRWMGLLPSSSTTSSCPLLHEEVKNPSRYENIALADMWKDIQGANSWNGLLQPMNPVLKGEILRYGTFAELCYDAFDSKISTNDLGGCKYSRDELFHGCKMAGDFEDYSNGYEVTKYLYADTDASIKQSVWIGFIAVCTNADDIRRLGRRDIVVAWRGTATVEEWKQNIRDFLVPARLSIGRFKRNSFRASKGLSAAARLRAGKGVLDRISSTTRLKDKGVRVEKGFLSCYISKGEDSRCARDTVKSEILRLVHQYKDDCLSITFTGHSLGAALATLSSYDVKKVLNENLPARPIPVTVFAFASPRVGNRALAVRMEELGVKVLRLVNKNDAVPKVPGLVLNENSYGWLCKLFDWLPWTYFHVGVKFVLESKDISHLDLVDAHSLKVYLDLIKKS